MDWSFPCSQSLMFQARTGSASSTSPAFSTVFVSFLRLSGFSPMTKMTYEKSGIARSSACSRSSFLSADDFAPLPRFVPPAASAASAPAPPSPPASALFFDVRNNVVSSTTTTFCGIRNGTVSRSPMSWSPSTSPVSFVRPSRCPPSGKRRASTASSARSM